MNTESGMKATKKRRDAKAAEVSGNRLTSSFGNGPDKTQTVAIDAKITCDGKAGKWTDLNESLTTRRPICHNAKNETLAITCDQRISEKTSHWFKA